MVRYFEQLRRCTNFYYIQFRSMRVNTHFAYPFINKSQDNLGIDRPCLGKQMQVFPKKSPIISRKQNDPLDSSICFISPKKIAYFKSIDESCLNEAEKTMVKKHGQKVEGATINLNLKEKEQQIDYRSIKRCLSPRYSHIQKSDARTLKQQKKSTENDGQQLLIKKEDKEAYERMILELKVEVLEISELLQEKQMLIERKDARIAELQRELRQEQVNQTIFDSSKSLSTFIEEKTPSNISSLPFLSYEDNSEKILDLEDRIRFYQQQLKKFQIEIDVLRKYRFDKQALQSELVKVLKKNESFKRKIGRLENKNNKLLQEIGKYRDIFAWKDQNSIILEFSPEKINL